MTQQIQTTDVHASREHTSDRLRQAASTRRRPVELRDYHDPLAVARWAAALERAVAAMDPEYARTWRPASRESMRADWLWHVLAPLLLHAWHEQVPTLPLLEATYPEQEAA